MITIVLLFHTCIMHALLLLVYYLYRVVINMELTLPVLMIYYGSNVHIRVITIALRKVISKLSKWYKLRI